jgi:hypothetical protein
MIGIYRDIASQTVTTSGNSGPMDTGGCACLSTQVAITAFSGTNPTFQIDVLASDDGVNFNVVHSTIQMVGIDTQRLSGIRISGRFFQINWTVTGTSPSFTFTVFNTLKDYLPTKSGSLYRYNDINLNVINSTSTSFFSFSNANTSLQIIRGADGNSNAVCVVEASNDNSNWDVYTGNISISSGDNETVTFSNDSFRIYRLRVVTPSSGAAAATLLWASNGGT